MNEPAVEAFREPYDHAALLPWMFALWSEHRHARGLSLPGGRGERLLVERMFVPPRIERAGRSLRPEAWLRELGRVALIGEGGAGRSFYARALIAGLCTRGPSPWKEVLGARVPLPLLPDQLDEDSGSDGLGLLERQLRRHPGPGEALVPELPRLLEDGQALVVLDGWDEVDDPRVRERVGGALGELGERYPRVGVLLTSSLGAWEDQPVEGFEALPLQGAVDRAELWGRLRELFGINPVRPPTGRAGDGDRPGDLYLRALLLAEGERALPVERHELIERVHERLLREWAGGQELGIPLALRRRWLEELALRMHRARVWGVGPRRPSEEQALGWLAQVEGEGLREVGSAGLPGEGGGEGESVGVGEQVSAWPSLRAHLREGLSEEGALTAWLRAEAEAPPPAELHPWLDGLERRLRRALREDLREAGDGRNSAPTEGAPSLAAGVAGAAGAFLRAGRRPGGLLVEERGTLGFVHLDHQDHLAAGALFRRLCRGWLDPEETQERVGEIGRMALRSAGFGVVSALFLRLQQEQPEFADQLAVEVFRERAAPRVAHRRLYRLAHTLGYGDQLARLAAALDGAGEERVGGRWGPVDLRALWVDAQGEPVDLGQLPPGGGVLYLRGAGRVKGARACDWVVVNERGRLTTGEGMD